MGAAADLFLTPRSRSPMITDDELRFVGRRLGDNASYIEVSQTVLGEKRNQHRYTCVSLSINELQLLRDAIDATLRDYEAQAGAAQA